MSDTPRTDAYEAKMLFEGLQDSFRVRNMFDTMRDLERDLADARKVSDRWAAEALRQRALLEQAIGHVKAQLYAEQTEPPYKARRETIELHDAICDALAPQPA